MLILTLRTLVVYLALILAMRLMGKRQLGELQPSELVSTILLSNLASISIEQPELPLAASLTPVFLIAVLEVLSSWLALHHPKLAQLLSGRPVPVIRNGVIDQNALRALRLTAADLLEALRGKDVFDPADVAYALVETDGTLNLVKQPGKETLLREDVGLSQPREAPPGSRLCWMAGFARMRWPGSARRRNGSLHAFKKKRCRSPRYCCFWGTTPMKLRWCGGCRRRKADETGMDFLGSACGPAQLHPLGLHPGQSRAGSSRSLPV